MKIENLKTLWIGDTVTFGEEEFGYPRKEEIECVEVVRCKPYDYEICYARYKTTSGAVVVDCYGNYVDVMAVEGHYATKYFINKGE